MVGRRSQSLAGPTLQNDAAVRSSVCVAKSAVSEALS